jgi:hypothetical protein
VRRDPRLLVLSSRRSASAWSRYAPAAAAGTRPRERFKPSSRQSLASEDFSFVTGIELFVDGGTAQIGITGWRPNRPPSSSRRSLMLRGDLEDGGAVMVQRLDWLGAPRVPLSNADHSLKKRTAFLGRRELIGNPIRSAEQIYETLPRLRNPFAAIRLGSTAGIPSKELRRTI